MRYISILPKSRQEFRMNEFIQKVSRLVGVMERLFILMKQSLTS